jgi:PKD repeat protein
MRKYLIFAGLILLGLDIAPNLSPREQYALFLKNHPFNNRPRLSPEQWKQVPKEDRPDLAWEQNFLATMDPALGRPAPERLQTVYQMVDQHQNMPLPGIPGSAGHPWVERGPDNVGGRTRALMWDPNASSGNKVWAGGVTGGLWYNNNITSASSAWVSVSNQWDNIAITAIAYDPNNTQTFYVGTGEGWGTGASRGAGIWKSTDGGATWTQLANTTGYHYVNDLVVRDENGTSAVYAACRENFFRGTWHGVNGLFRSVNGGSSWTQVMPNAPGSSQPYAVADLEIAADNRIWVGTQQNSQLDGGGRVMYSDNGTTWTVSRTIAGGERVEVAVAPSNSFVVYALTESQGQAHEIARSTNKGSSWLVRNEPNDADLGIPATDFTRGQAWYDLILQVDPNNQNTIIAGGIDLFRSTDGAGTWSQISKWSNNNNLANLSCSYVHADQHQVQFKPGSSSTVIFGTDGGVFYTSSLATAATSNVISARNQDYNVTQFYAAALHPTAGSNYALAGAQDNGTQQFTAAGFGSTTRVTGGDGAYCFIDQTNPNYQITSYVYNYYWRSTNGGSFFSNTPIQSDFNTGRFINPADYDDQQNILYSTRNASTVNRISNVTGSPSVGSISISGMNSWASHLRVSPYTTSSTTLFVGTEAGDLFKVTNANASPSSTNISGSSFPNAHLSCVELGADEDEIIVTFSNYGVTSVWFTDDGGSTWQNKEGNLPDMPVRWALFNPNDRNQVILATEVGVWSTSNFNSSSPNWVPSNSGLSRVRVDMLQIRDSDDEVIAATHGRGLFSSDAFNAPPLPIADFYPLPEVACLNQTITLSDSSTGGPTTWNWSISPNTFSFVNGTSASSQHPEVQLSAAGSYDITLVVSNANGSDTLTKIGALRGGGLPLPFTEDFEGSTSFTVDNPDNGITWSLYSIGGTSPGSTAAGIDFFNYNATGERDGLISPLLDFSNYTSVDLDFDYAYARYSSSYRDSMAIFVSTDCGATYSRVASYTSDAGSNFATVSDQTSQFSPSVSSEWCGNTLIPSCPSIDLSAYAGQSEVIIKWEAINGYGNNLYIDNINISGVQNTTTPIADFSVDSASICVGGTVNLSDQTANTPTAWSWSISPNTYSFVGGTSASSQNPQVQFNAAGNYQVSLTATNGFGNDTKTVANFISVNALASPSVSISGNANSWCSGQTASFSASPSNGGSSPSYQWKVNGVNAGSNSANFSSSTLNNGDVVTVEMTGNAYCTSSGSVSSNSITVSITPLVVPTVSISSSSTSLCAGSNVSFSATVSNAGNNPVYQWKVNGTNVGSNSSNFSTTGLANNDQVSLEVTGSGACASPVAGVSNTLSMNVRPLPVITVPSPPFAPLCPGDSLVLTATVNNHGIPGILTNWSGPGVQNNVFYADLAGPGNHTLSVGYLYASSPDCPVNESLQISVQNFPSPSISRNGLTLTCNPGGYNYLWLLNGSPAPGTNNQQSYSLTVNGSYTVEMSGANCVLESDPEDVIDMSLEDLRATYVWQVYPNPSREQVYFSLRNPGASSIEIRLLDSRGALMRSETRQVNGSEIKESLPLQGLAEGVYQLQVIVGELRFQEAIRKIGS